MATMVRDFGIVFVLVVLVLSWRLYNAITGRGKRKRERETEQRQAQAEQASRRDPMTGLGSYAAGRGWSVPGTDPPFGDFTGDYVHQMIRHLWHDEESSNSTTAAVGDNGYADVVTGGTAPRTWVVANAWIPGGLGARSLTAGVCVMDLGKGLPPLFVSPHGDRPFITMFLKEVTLESEDFDRRYRVLALDQKYAMDVMNPRAMELVMSRDHWAFFLELEKVVCVSRGALETTEDVQGLLDSVTRFVDLIPSFVYADKALQLPTLPDGTTLDPTDPASRQRMEQAFEAMTPDQRQQAVSQMQAQGARFLMGMLGKDMTSDQAQAVVHQLAEHDEKKE